MGGACGWREFRGRKGRKIALGFPVLAGKVDDGGCFLFPGDFLQGEWGAQEILGELAAAIEVIGSDGLFSAVEAEATVFPVDYIIKAPSRPRPFYWKKGLMILFCRFSC
ncbi:MAG: hypothetical protein ACI9R3_001051 [Verrucomicrobiales bacterium]